MNQHRNRFAEMYSEEQLEALTRTRNVMLTKSHLIERDERTSTSGGNEEANLRAKET